MELENANDLLQLSRKKGNTVIPEESLSTLSPMAAASSAILRKGMTLTQVNELIQHSKYFSVNNCPAMKILL